MKAIVLTSSSYRHKYFAAIVSKQFELAAVVCEEKRNYYKSQREQSNLIKKHFKNLAETEKKWFQIPDDSHLPDFIHVDDINSADTLNMVASLDADCVLLYGTSILKSPWLEAFPEKIINLHLGLSPYYRGSATLFWPFAFQELEYLGTTIHLAIEKVDAGAVLHQVLPNLESGDDYYTITNRLIRDSINVLPNVVADYLAGKNIPKSQELSIGRICKKADFNEDVLTNVHDYIGDGLAQEEINRIKEARCHLLL
jgi:methionyl-tRNA formyltransferase